MRTPFSSNSVLQEFKNWGIGLMQESRHKERIFESLSQFVMSLGSESRDHRNMRYEFLTLYLCVSVRRRENTDNMIYRLR